MEINHLCCETLEKGRIMVASFWRFLEVLESHRLWRRVVNDLVGKNQQHSPGTKLCFGFILTQFASDLKVAGLTNHRRRIKRSFSFQANLGEENNKTRVGGTNTDVVRPPVCGTTSCRDARWRELNKRRVVVSHTNIQSLCLQNNSRIPKQN